MKTTFKFMIIGLLSLIVMSCGESKGRAAYPKNAAPNKDQITGIIISKPLKYDERLGYKLAIDENKDGFFTSSEEHYAWMPNDMYKEVSGKDSITVKAVHFYEYHVINDCNEYIIFSWCKDKAVSPEFSLYGLN